MWLEAWSILASSGSCIGERVSRLAQQKWFTHSMQCRDLAARNVLLDVNLGAKISDLGRAVCLDIGQDSVVDTSLKDTPVRWMAPECLHSCSYYRASDVW